MLDDSNLNYQHHYRVMLKMVELLIVSLRDYISCLNEWIRVIIYDWCYINSN